MPRPPLLPTIDWSAVHASGKTWSEWLDSAEDPAQAEAMRTQFESHHVPAELEARLSEVSRRVNVVAIAEDWCGDVVRNTPPLARIEEMQPLVSVRFITRAAFLDVFARFLTNGGEAIPKFVFLSDKFVECGSWGPMQADCRLLVSRGKACGDVAAARVKVKEIYQADTHRVQVYRELIELAELASCDAP